MINMRGLKVEPWSEAKTRMRKVDMSCRFREKKRSFM